MPSPIDPPNLSSDVSALVDWLELSALFDQFGVARLDSLLGSLQELEEGSEDDIGERDKRRDQLVENIENEVEIRRACLDIAYPFEMGESAESLILDEDWAGQRFSFYLVCLVTSHVSGSEILRVPPRDDLLQRLRNDIFQLIATLGLAGAARGPAYSIGWPRHSGERIIELLGRASRSGGGFNVLDPPGRYVSPGEKDGGVDVLAWTDAGRPPPTALCFGQTASGKNWIDKPVHAHAQVFMGAYMRDVMTGNVTYYTIIPFRVEDERFWNEKHKLHHAILDRLRLPRNALEGLEIAGRGVNVDGSERASEVAAWIADFVAYAQAA